MEPSEGEPEAEIQVSERGGKPGILRPGRPDLRVELFDPTAIPSADEFEPIGADDITAENQGADLLLIAHHDFLEGIAPLAEFHRSQGLRVHVTDVQSVYDTFSDGELSPLALRDFFAYTLTHWKQGAPTHILLAGDCSSDYLDYARKNVKNWVPTYDFEANWDRWASDEWMGLVAGKDALSDFMIGRISVNNTKDLDAVVQKYVHAGTDYPIGPWRARDILVADNEPEFPRLLDEFHQQNVPSAIETKRIFLNELPMEDNFYADDERRKGVFQEEGRWMKVSPAATEKLLAALTDGAGVLAYFGHGSPNVWSDERIWFGGDSVNSDNLHLSGMKKPPFVVNFTCNSGAIDYPIPQWNINIIEDMIRIENGGALAAFVPSGPVATGLQEALGNLMFKVIFRERPQTIGEIATLTRARFAATGLADEYVYMYILLGDPLLEAPLTAHVREFELPRDVYQPGEKIETTLAPVTPPEGKYLVQLESTRGETLWQSEPTTYGTGRIPVAVNLQSSLPTGKYAVRVYGWNEAARTDLAASAEFDAAYPEDEIATATLKSLGTKQTRIGVLVKNIGKLDSVDRRIELLALRDGSASPLGGKGYDVGAGKSVRLDFTVANSTDRTTPALKTAYEIRLLDTPPDSAKPRRVLQVKRIAPAGFEPPPYQGPDLRIAHNSIRLDPEKPSEGETIFVHFLVENEGDEPSALARATLLDGDPTSG
ncbi:hypothetical protein HY256_07075, partial [Candidatus Sumerlaeota bacterium]|nr:hypothetical protein [Candidatus Sumerlaeota bacterium]